MDRQSQVKIVHSDKKIGKCDTCNKELSIKYITQHKKLVHSDLKENPCKTCDKSFKA